ncbi:MAG: hypothetical protein ABR577_11125 [Pyrinomonadaceae bacterium]
MGRLKRTSKIMDNAARRISGMKAIRPALDLGGDLTVAKFEAAIEDTRAKLNDYNQTLSIADEKQNLVIAAEQNLRDLSERMLAGVAARYGKDSNEYEQGGGIRKSERKKRLATKNGSSTSPAA